MTEAHQPPKPLVVPERRALFAACSATVFSATVLACSVWVTGCQRSADTTSGGTGSQTGWLLSCNTTNDCEVGQCLCGACSRECSLDSECQALDSNARCAAVSSVSGCSVAPVERLCASQSTSMLETPSSAGADGVGGASTGSGGAETAGEAGSASTNTPGGGNSSTTTGGSASGSSAGQETGGQPATGGSAGQSSGGMASGGEPSAGAGGQDAASVTEDFPWPELPSARGVVVGSEDADVSVTGCCSRVPGSEPNDYCLPGVEARLAQVIPSNNGIVMGTAFDLMTGTTPVGVAFDSAVPVTIGVMETELVPPEGIVDMSPVFWVGGVDAEADLPSYFMIALGGPSYGYSVNQPDGLPPRIYYSADGAEFEPLESAPAMYGAFVEKAGFVVLGAGPDSIQCQLE